MRTGLLLTACLALAACGGNSVSRYDATPSRSFLATGPVSQACLRAGRKAANRQLCSCIQNVANRDLSSADQRLAAGFFADPHQAQVMRQSDNVRHEAFWQRYKAWAARAESVCRGL